MNKTPKYEIKVKFTDGTVEICKLNACNRHDALNKYLYILNEQRKLNEYNDLIDLKIKEI